jgi:hypothetical protein
LTLLNIIIMASVDSPAENGVAVVNGSELSAAQKLMQKHAEAHRATLEDVPDDDDLKHGEQPVSSSILEGPGDVPAPEWVPPMSAKAAGKQKENESQQENKPLLDTQSEELFPGLGGAPKPKQAAASKPTWNFGKAGPNGSSATNGANGISTNGTSTPISGMDTPLSVTSQAASWSAPRPMNIPGQQQQRYTLKTNQMLPRTQMKKPLPDVLKDINKRSKANVTFSQAQDGITFIGNGPTEAVYQALRDVVGTVGAKVRSLDLASKGNC